MADIEKKLVFLLCTSPYLDTLENTYEEYEKAARDLIANGVTIAADVAPVVHGEWINKTIPYRADVEQRVDCSACKHIFFHTSALTYNYCPNCGAKMDGERRSE